MTTIYDYADVLRMIADREELQINVDTGVWEDVSAVSALQHVIARVLPPSDFRVKPKTVVINGVECMPPRHTPPSTVYRVNFELTCSDSPAGNVGCSLGFDSYAEAAAVYKALLLPFKVKA